MRARFLLRLLASVLVVLGLLAAVHRGFAARRTGDTEIVILSSGAVQGYIEPCG
jgi:hypothetical protein